MERMFQGGETECKDSEDGMNLQCLRTVRNLIWGVQRGRVKGGKVGKALFDVWIF